MPVGGSSCFAAAHTGGPVLASVLFWSQLNAEALTAGAHGSRSWILSGLADPECLPAHCQKAGCSDVGLEGLHVCF